MAGGTILPRDDNERAVALWTNAIRVYDSTTPAVARVEIIQFN